MKEFDLFAQPFNFEVQRGKKQRGTRTGAILSILILAVCLAYLGYLLYRFFVRANPPTISTSSIINKVPTSVTYDYPLIQLQFNVPDGEDVSNYLQANAWVEDLSLKNKQSNAPIPMANCSNYAYLNNPNLYTSQWAYCLQPEIASQMQQSFTKKRLQRFVWIVIGICNMTAQNPKCRNDQSDEFTNNLTTLLYNELFNVQLSIQLKSVDTINGNLIDNSDETTIILDPNTFQEQFIDVQRTIDSVDRGAFIADRHNTTVISSYNDQSVFMSRDFTTNYYNEALFQGSYYAMRLSLQRVDMIQNVVYEKIGSPLAQFFSIFDILLGLGIIARMVSDARIFEMVVDRYLSIYYRSTAAQFKSLKKKEQATPETAAKDTAKGAPESQPVKAEEIKLGEASVTNLQLKNNGIEMAQIQKVAAPDRTLKFNQIVPKEDDKILELTTLQSVKMQNSAPKIVEQINNGEKAIALSGLSRAEQVYAMIFEDSQRQCAYTSMYADLLSLKNGIQLLFTEKQYAAMAFVGRSLDDVVDTSVDSALLNHLERLDRIDRDPVVREKYVIELIRDGKLGRAEGLDKRLYDCLIQRIKDPSVWIEHFGQGNQPPANNAEGNLKKTDEAPAEQFYF